MDEKPDKEKPDEVVDEEDDEDADEDVEDEDEEDEEEKAEGVSRRKRVPEARQELKRDSKSTLATESETFSEEEAEEESEGPPAPPPATGPAFLTWTPAEVADWIGSLGFPEYQTISHHVRQLLEITEPPFSRSITLPHRDNMGLFLEQKSRTGKRSDALTYSQFIQDAHLQEYEPHPPTQEPSPITSSLSLK